MALKTNYKDDGFTGNRKYRQVTNADGTLSFEDVTPYNPVGDSFGAKDINDTNTAINAIQTPDFEDYESGASVPDAETALTAIKKKADVSTLLKNIKAALKGAFLKKYILTTMEQVMANTLAGRTADARLLKEVNQNLNGYQFGMVNGVPSYKAGADAAWVPLGSGIYYIADYGELAVYGTSPKTYTIPVPDYVKSRVAASVYNNADNYVGLADTVVGIAPGGIPGNHHHPSTLTVNDGVITITVGAKGASYYVQPRGKIYLVTGSIISA